MFVPFLIAAIVLAVTPGPGVTYVIARTIAGGRTEGLASCAGTAVGGMVHVLAAAAGLSIVLAKSAVVFGVLKYLGALYLLYLGVRILLKRNETFSIRSQASHGARKAFLEGVLVEGLNVKTALFFVAFLPQFVSMQAPLAPQLFVLGSICVLLNTMVDLIAVFGADRMLRKSAVRATRARLLNRLSGFTMIGLGAYLALAERDS
ncbi:LysE family translocator [Orrella marina]|uniref:RhtB family transporter n=1 Tax=Orrella marina TaxID=2163011 RepID=A0A2R4XKS9_9BURK|nr:LysE family translocator [Orrella marina]AWB34309.1 RhtB family transporter [Orrella marina]